MTKYVSNHGDPSCLAHFAPGQISHPTIKKKKSMNNLASTYVAYSPDGSELLVNLSGEHVYLYETTAFTEGLKYDCGKPESVPSLQTHRYTTMYSPTVKIVSSPDYHMTAQVGHVTPHPFPQQELSDSDVTMEVRLLKDKGLDLTRTGHTHMEERLCRAVDCLSQAIALCPVWHELYYLRAVAFYSRKW